MFKTVFSQVCLSLALVIILFCSDLQAQRSSELIDFHGGKYLFKLSQANSLFSGLGSRMGAFAGDLGGQRPTSESILWNPANLGFLSKSEMILDCAAPLALNPAGLVDLDGQVHTAVDEVVADMGGENLVLTDQDYPYLDLSLGTVGGWRGGSFALRLGEVSFCAAMHRPMQLAIEALGTGFEARMKTISESDPTREVTLFSSADLSLSANVDVSAVAFGVGKTLTPRWAVGVAWEQLSGSVTSTGRLEVEGIMVTAGNEHAFNDPSDPWNNGLHSHLQGSYEGTSSTYHFGTTYRLDKNWGIGTVLSIARSLRMAGHLDIVQRTLTGLNLQAEGDEDFLDPTKVSLDEPTRTVLRDNPTGRELTLNLPSSMAVGVSGKLGFLGLSFRYCRYFGEFSYNYPVGKAPHAKTYSQGLRLSNGFNLGMDFKYLYLGAGVTQGETVGNVGENFSGQKLLLPNFALGIGFGIFRDVRADLLLAGFPAGVGKLSLTYAF